MVTRRAFLGATAGPATARAAREGAPRVLQVMSYRGDWQWARDQSRGFRDGLALPQAQWRTVELDAKHADAASVRQRGAQALALAAQWQPQLVFATDDAAQDVVGRRLAGGATPLVFSGVNGEPADYGYALAPNVTGVLEREHVLGCIHLLQRLRPGTRRLALVFDEDPGWQGMASRLRQALARRADLEVLAWLTPRRWSEYQQEMLALQGRVDAVGLIGIFRFATGPDTVADYEDVLRWTAEHSRPPDFSFWDTRVERGTLCAVTIDGVEQGLQAGRLARRILVDGVPPGSLPMQPTARGRPAISLARARALGLRIDADVLLHAAVYKRYAWER